MSDAKLSRKLSRTSDEPYLYESYSKDNGELDGDDCSEQFERNEQVDIAAVVSL